MPRLRFLLALAVLLAAAVFTAQDEWPWPRPVMQAPAVVADIFTETVDTLRSGETISELFLRQGLKGFMLASEVDRSVFDLRRLRAGLVFNFRRKLTDSLPSQVVVRTGPEQKVNLHSLPMAGGRWPSQLSGSPKCWPSKARSITRSTKRLIRIFPTRCSTEGTG